MTNKTESNKNPITVINEYACQNRLVPEYKLLQTNIVHNEKVYKYALTLNNDMTVGTGISKKKAKHVAASEMIMLILNNQNTSSKNKLKNILPNDLTNFSYEFNKVINSVGKLYDICLNRKLGKPEFKFIRESGPAHSKQYTVSCQIAKMYEEATMSTKQEAKNHSASKMLHKLLSTDKSLCVNFQQIDSNEVVKRVEIIKHGIKKNIALENMDYSKVHLFFKMYVKPGFVKLNKLVQKYSNEGELNLIEPYNILNQIVQEANMNLVKTKFNVNNLDLDDNIYYAMIIDNVYPSITGLGVDKDVRMAKCKAAIELLNNMCILLK